MFTRSCLSFSRSRALPGGLSWLTTRAKTAAKKEAEVVIKQHGEFLYGVAPCTAALHLKRRKVYSVYMKKGYVEKKAASKRPALVENKVRKIAEELRADFHLVERHVLDKISGNRPHQGVVLDVAPLNFRRMEVSDCKLSAAASKEKPVWVLLDEVQDPMNLGAILRSCYYLGVKRVVTSQKRCCPLSPAVSKASAGAMELMPVFTVSHLESFLQEARGNGWQILGTAGTEEEEEEERVRRDRDGKRRPRTPPLSVNCLEYTKQGPTLLVLGNEGHGLHREVKEQCDVMVTVQPHRTLPPGFDSLNVGVATGILLHSLQR